MTIYDCKGCGKQLVDDMFAGDLKHEVKCLASKLDAALGLLREVVAYERSWGENSAPMHVIIERAKKLLPEPK